MKIYTSWGEFGEDIGKLKNCIIYISKSLEKTITRKSKLEIIELKTLLRLRKIRIKVVTMPIDTYRDTYTKWRRNGKN